MNLSNLLAQHVSRYLRAAEDQNFSKTSLPKKYSRRISFKIYFTNQMLNKYVTWSVLYLIWFCWETKCNNFFHFAKKLFKLNTVKTLYDSSTVDVDRMNRQGTNQMCFKGFVTLRFFFHISYHYWGEEYNLLDRGLLYIEVC